MKLIMIEQTDDGGYIISGSTESYGFGGSDIWLIKSGPNGLIEWNTYIGTEHNEKGGQVIQTEDGGYLVIGNLVNQQEQDSDVWLIKLILKGIPFGQKATVVMEMNLVQI